MQEVTALTASEREDTISYSSHGVVELPVRLTEREPVVESRKGRGGAKYPRGLTPGLRRRPSGHGDSGDGQRDGLDKEEWLELCAAEETQSAWGILSASVPLARRASFVRYSFHFFHPNTHFARMDQA